ncbi:shikimate dehydrogenase [Steroidobacter denitrificans]|uniref:Shikimate dehydrogenase (NADP(+)) n=1 Tax=Steroidobacter denitrificans TaxID=465721 RepID=A0A127F7P2_STEDE|nr:shikimate dehydrogenase [Steroidobacter denitrificans]
MGHPVAHSWSPFIHGMFAKQTDQNISYGRLDVDPEEFSQAVDLFFTDGGKGLNITIPHKQAACLVARYRTPRAEIAGAVNTLALLDDGILGDNTDGAGLVTDLTRNLGFTLTNARILLLGAGGAARGVLGPLLATAPESILIANRGVERAGALAKEFGMLGSVHACGFGDIDVGTPFDLVLNATSASLQDTVPPIPAAIVGAAALAYDMAYGKGDTAFTRWAKMAGVGRAETGWGMLVEQAAESFTLWRGIKPDTKPVLDAVKSR